MSGSYTTYAVQLILDVIALAGPREPGSDAELKGAYYMRDQLVNYTDSVVTESFIVKPECLMAWVYLDGALIIVAMFLYNFQFRLYAFISTSIAVVLLIAEFLLYWEFIDDLYPAHTSTNVVGRIAPVGEVQRRIIFNGHIDSMYEWNYNYLGGHVLFRIVTIGAMGGLVILWFLQIVTSLCSWQGWLAALFLIMTPFWGAVLFFTSWDTIVEGANDNLTGCATALAVAKYIREVHGRFQNTEVVILITGSEESGLRGAKAYAKAHPPDDIETAFICYDTVRDLDHMLIIDRDMTATVPLDGDVVKLMHKGGLLGGMDLAIGPVPFGSTDAAAMQQGGYRSASFVAMSFDPADFYHTRRDSHDNLDPVVIGHGIDLAIGTLLTFDLEGLNGTV